MKAGDLVKKSVLQDYLEKTSESKNQDSLAKKSLPGGDTRWSTYYLPYPVHMDHADGYEMVDVDGSRYIDLQNNYTVLVHGHRHPAVVAAVQDQLNRDIIFGAPCRAQYELADILTQRLPGLDKIRFTNSGTEATMMAMRTARAYTKRDIILKMDGGYHGSHDFTEVNITPDLSGKDLPKARLEQRGVPDCVLDAVMVARFNDLDSVESILKQHADRIAAVIIEPVMNASGIIAAEPEFLRGVRHLADRYGVLLIFDEVVTLRLHEHGIQGKYDVIPDITALGKVMGGGFAIGAFGGREEIMHFFDPAVPHSFHHSGTFNGHNFAMAAGAAAMRALTADTIEHINTLGEYLADGIAEAAEVNGVWENTTQSGSLLYMQWCRDPVVDAADVLRWKKRAAELPKLMHMELLNRGVFTANRGLMNISTPMDRAVINRIVEAIDGALRRLKPYIEEQVPHLLR